MPHIVSKMQNFSQHIPEQIACMFLSNGIDEREQLTYRELDEKARKVAAFLQQKNLAGERILLVYPPGLNFIVGFLGCLYAGVIAVPVSCPPVTEFEKSQSVLNSIANDADVAAIFSDEIYLQPIELCFSEFKKNKTIFIMDPLSLSDPTTQYQITKIDENTIAYLQYTSGSTSAPKAAIVSHGNLTQSVTVTLKAWHYSKKSVTLNWAPHTHVYGLVCGVLMPLYHGSLAILMSPSAFVRNPLLWLQAITHYRVSHSGCPNFGYNVCIRDISKEKLAEIDLSSWKVAINGGEQVQADTLYKFIEKFKSCGFKPQHMCSAYGMSELTGAIAVNPYGKDSFYLRLSSQGLQTNTIVVSDRSEKSRQFVSSGELLPGIHAAIVDPSTLLPAASNTIGEIWLSGKQVVAGYWRRPEESQHFFNLSLPNSNKTYFRTGDLGFFHENKLYITGRLKELIVIHGKKYYPTDLEMTLATALKKFSIKNCCIIFSTLMGHHEALIVVEEVPQHLSETMYIDIANTIRHALMQHHGVDPAEIILVKENTIPKTSSGKLQRKLCQQQFLNNQLDSIFRDAKSFSKKETQSNSMNETMHTFIQMVASVLEMDSSQIDLQAPLSRYGFDSIHIIKLTQILNETFQFNLSPAVLFEYSTLQKFYDDHFAHVKHLSEVNSHASSEQDIAIIGMNGVFPGAKDLPTFWDNLIQGNDGIREIPKERWDWQEYQPAVKWGGFIDDISQFDAPFFQISAHEAELMDPQQRQFLQIVWKTIEEAGYATAELARNKVGLFVGVMNHDYAEILQQNDISDAFITTGISPSVLANRISYLLNFQGPSETIDTACSSSLVAIHHAITAIQRGDCEIAIAGGVNALLTPTSYRSATNAGMLCPDGRCKTFDKNANGYVRAEGMAAILLKPLHRAIAEGDHIYAIVKGSAVNHGGHVNSLTVPNPNAQAEVIVKAWQRAGIGAANIQYIEAHGTGTALGDPIEINGLKKAFHQLHSEKLSPDSCVVGSVKTHIGHLESAAGIAGVIKVVLAMQHQQLPGNLHFSELNPYINLADSPFCIANKMIPWPLNANHQPRYAGVSSFGFGGTNAHVALAEYLPHVNMSIEHHKPYIIALSAKTYKALQQRIIDLYSWLEKQKNIPPLRDVSYTLNMGRDHFDKRCVFIVQTIDELINELKNLSTKDLLENVSVNRTQSIELQSFAEAYLNKQDISWKNFYSDTSCQRLSLPTYPFANERYWAPLSHKKLDTYSQNGLHPLIDKNISTLYLQSFSKQYAGNEFYFKDHRVGQQFILPGAVILEMIRAATSFALPNNNIIHLQNIHWIKPIVAASSMPPVHVNFYPENTRIRFTVTQQDEIYTQGNVATMPSSRSHMQRVNVSLLQQRCQYSISSEKLYADFKKVGIEYGQSFQVIKTIHYNDTECLVKMQLPACLRESSDAFYWHPSILDGALHASFTLLQKSQQLYVPSHIGEVINYRSLEEIVYAYITLLPRTEADQQPQFTIQILNASGELLLVIDELTLTSLQKNKSLEKTIAYYHPVWIPQSIAAHDSAISGPILVIDSHKAIVSSLRSMHPDYIVLEAYEEGLQQDQYQNLLDHLKQKNVFPEVIIFYVKPSQSAIDHELDASVYPFFKLAQALAQYHLKQSIQLLVVTEKSSLCFQAMAGFIKALHVENPNIIGKVIQFENVDDILSEYIETAIEVQYDSQHMRHVKHYQEITPSALTMTPIKKKGVYWITGGMGGLGLIYARYLIDNYHATVILTGRSSLTHEQQNQLAQLGSSVFYEPADLTHREDVVRVYEKIKKQFLVIHGIVHAAGVTHDAFLLKKTQEEFAKVIAVKIYGTHYLDEVTKTEPLDFFIIFSSVSSIFGNVGQTDYAYANGYVDAFAEQRNEYVKKERRYGKTIAINWPYWQEGGKHIDQDSLHFIEKSLGLVALTTEEGIQAFLNCLTMDASQQVVLVGHQQTFESALLRYQHTPGAHKQHSVIENISHDSKRAIENYLREVLAATLKMSVDDIQSEESFESYGIDSVMIIKLNQRLAEDFDALPKTLFFEYQTLAALTDYFFATHGEKLQTQLKIESTPLPRFHAPAVIVQSSPQSAQDDIAIIGIDGRYPQAPHLAAFWENLKNGKDCITEIPKKRWHSDGKKYWGGFIEDIDTFDPLFFNIAPREAECMDPQERLFLETAWNVFEDAGYAYADLSGKKIGVYVGVMYGQYQLFGAEQALLGNVVPTQSMYASIANRVSYYFNLHGPSLALDTMCSSSLTAIHLACQSIQKGECEMALAGGVNLSVHPNKYMLLSQGNFLASDGRCRSFGEGGDGYVPSEGVGAVLLKSLQHALQDGDVIYGVIKGSSINHGGKTNGYTVPNPAAQAAVIEEAYRKAHVSPEDVNYIETHGTGTALGDPIEIAALSKIFNSKNYPIGSVKSNIGHCESAAGMAALTKVLLQMQHKMLVPSLHSQQLNKNIDWKTVPFQVQQALAEWKGPHLAGISSFGAGGANAHLIISGVPERMMVSETSSHYLILLSAKTELALQQKIKDLIQWLNTSQASMEDISYTLQVGRTHFEKRCALVVDSIAHLRETLHRVIQQQTVENFLMNTIIKKNANQATIKKLIDQLIKEIDYTQKISVAEYRDNLLALAQFYIDGYNIDWKLLYQGKIHRKISLPTYPFAKEYCWWSPKDVAVEQLPALLDAKESIGDYLKHQVSTLLKIKLEDIDIHKNLYDYGFDSVTFVDFSKQLSEHFQISLTPEKFYAYNTIHAIEQYLQELHPTEIQAKSNRDISVSLISKNFSEQDIAIIGMDGMFPQSPNLEVFWQHIVAGKDLISEIPATRWDWHQNYGDAKQDSTKTNSKWGGFIADVDHFDAEFFNISAREANLMDPQQRLWLEVVWKTIENAGYDPFSFAGKKIGVFAGVEFNEYQTLIAQHHQHFHGYVATGNSHSILPNRISYFLNLTGPSEAIDTACSSSLVAMHRAIHALRKGECTSAIVGGSSLILNPDTYVIMSQMGALSPDGRCKTFDQSANGYVKGEGVAAILLKPLSTAIKDGDHIYGVIKGSAVNHGGKAQSLTAPNVLAQSELLVSAYSEANINPETISYIEAHGTGTALGDPAEIEGLKLAFKKLLPESSKKYFCGINSVKTNIGHLEPASGMAGIIKVLLALQHEMLPGNIHLKEKNPYIDLHNSPFYLMQNNQPWMFQKATPRRAGISSFGFGGTNAHIILEEPPLRNKINFPPKLGYLITLSAKNPHSLKQKIRDLHRWCHQQSSLPCLESLSFTLNIGRAHFDYRCAMVIDSFDELKNALTSLLYQHAIDCVVFSNGKKYDTNAHELYRSTLDNLRQKTDQYKNHLWVLANLYCNYYPLEWKEIYNQALYLRMAGLPNYPFHRKRYWFDLSEPKQAFISHPLEATFQERVIAYLRQIFSENLQISPEQINEDKAYEGYGADSILTLTIIHQLEKELGELPKAILYENNSLRALASYLVTHYQDALQKLLSKNVITASNSSPHSNHAWIAYRTKQAQAKIRLFCFPYAGSGASIYRNWQRELSDTIEVCPIQLPGRENRMDEDFIPDMNLLVSSIVNHIRSDFDLPFAFFGHSFGALVAFEVIRYLRRHHLPLPVHFFASAYPTPGVLSKNLDPLLQKIQGIDLHTLQDEQWNDLVTTFSKSGLVEYDDKRIHKDIMKVLLPIFMADMTIVKNYHYQAEAPLDLPMTIFIGKYDTWVPYEDHLGWAGQSSQCHFHPIDGGHLFIKEACFIKEILQKITESVISCYD